MNKAEKLLRLCADTMKMPGWNDALSMMTEKNFLNALSDDMLEDVAGGRQDPSSGWMYDPQGR